MIYFENGQALAEEVQKLTEVECFYRKRKQAETDHFIIDDLSDRDFYADNKIHNYITQVQLSFFTKSPYRSRKYLKTIKDNFNAKSMHTYDSAEEWYQTVFEFEVIYKNER